LGYYVDGLKVPDDITLLWADDTCDILLTWHLGMRDWFCGFSGGEICYVCRSRTSLIVREELVYTTTWVYDIFGFNEYISNFSFSMIWYNRLSFYIFHSW